MFSFQKSYFFDKIFISLIYIKPSEAYRIFILIYLAVAPFLRDNKLKAHHLSMTNIVLYPPINWLITHLTNSAALPYSTYYLYEHTSFPVSSLNVPICWKEQMSLINGD